MNISYNWLRELVAIQMPPQKLARRLTFAGLAVEAVHPAGDDFVLELDLTSNRGDCLSHLGVAREVAALEGAKVQSSKLKVQSVARRAEDFAAVEVRDADLCPRYAARIVRGVTIAPSPEWLVKRLEAIGQRPLNNVADITNYVLFELGQPLHAFDLAKLAGQEIVVRRARAGEKMKTLDDVERVFDSEMLLICDAERAVAVAGVMGGLDTEITDATTDVLLESAYFTPSTVRRASRLLGLSTEASKRFERGIDPEGVIRAQERAIALICEIAGGTATENAIDVYPDKHHPVTLGVRPERVKKISGMDVQPAEISRLLQALGFNEQGAQESYMMYAAPSWRHDLEREEDLIEEVARCAGYDKIPSILPPATSAGEYLPNDNRRRALRREMAANGYDEAIKFSFISDAHDDSLTFLPDLNTGAGFITLSNSILEHSPRMRPSLITGLLEATRHNFNQGARDVRLFELGRVFAAGQPLPDEREAWALLATGRALDEGVATTSRELDFYDLKGVIEAAAESMGFPRLSFAPAEAKHLQPGQSAQISFTDGRVLGYIGRLREDVSAIYKFRQAVYLAELDLANLLSAEASLVRFKQLPRFPAIVRDISLLIARQVTWAELQQAVLDLQLAHCQSVQLVDVYEGTGIPDDQRAVTVRLEYRAATRTLRDEEAATEHSQVVATLVNTLGAQQRA